jgi:hypothetical protein
MKDFALVQAVRVQFEIRLSLIWDERSGAGIDLQHIRFPCHL